MGIAATIQEPAEGLIFQGKKSVEPILRTENLWKLYRAGKVEVPALRGVNFEVQPGESVAVMGPSGCGKSSLLYVIGGLAQASRGKVLVDGNDLTELSDAARTKLRRHKIGFVFQRFNLLPTLTAKGNMAIARAIINEPKILLADEPTGNLDSKNSEIVLQMLRQLNKDLGQTIVMITHNPEATTYFDRVVHMRDGVIVDGVPAD